jgi:1,4-alpha-glucan branching enzyme
MLYLDFSRGPGEWLPNRHGGNEHIEAYQFLRAFNDRIHERFPGVITIAEESSAWPGVTRTTELGGVGFDLKWDMGWMHDSLRYFRRSAEERPERHSALTFRMMYGYSEQFMLALSHDEVVHEKAPLIGKMPGDDPERFANLRTLFGYQWALPGKTLVFMGGEFAQRTEWNHDTELEWDLLRWSPHAGMRRWVRDLNRLSAEQPALHERDFDPSGFSWIDANDAARGVVSFLRYGGGSPVAFVANLSQRRHRRYRIGVPVPGVWKTLLNSDATSYGGSGRSPGRLATTPRTAHGHDQSLVVDLPPFTAVFLTPGSRSA